MRRESDDWYEGQVEDVFFITKHNIKKMHEDDILVKDLWHPEEREWVNLRSGRIAPVGMFSGAFGKAMFEREDQKENYVKNGHVKPTLLKGKFEDSKASPKRGDKKRQTTANLYENLKAREIQFQHKLSLKGWKIKEVAGDGNCLFRALSDQLYGSDEFHTVLREWCMNYLVVEKDYFSQYIIGGADAFNEYVEHKRQNAVWGDDIEIQAFSEIYGIPIEIYAYDDKPMRTFHEISSGITSIMPARLSYHGHSHFNSVFSYFVIFIKGYSIR